MKRLFFAWLCAGLLVSCEGVDEGGANDPSGICCSCLVEVNCVEPDEYEFCKDTLARGGTIQLSPVRALTCNRDACVEANRCSNGDDGQGGAGGGEGGAGGGQGGAGGGQGGAGGVPGATRFVLTMVGATYEDKDWDGIGNDAPDPYVRIVVDGEVVGITETLQDDYMPAWNESFTVELAAQSTLAFEFFDDDLAADDGAGTYEVSNLAAVIASGGQSVDLSGSGVENITFTLEER